MLDELKFPSVAQCFFSFAIGSGWFGKVHRMKLERDASPDQPLIIAVKEINLCQTNINHNSIIKESELGICISNCDFAVKTYGFLKHSTFVRILMEIMDSSIESLRQLVSYFK